MTAVPDVLKTVAGEIFENLAFMVTQDETEPVGGGQRVARAAIRFSGPFNGTMILEVSESILGEIAGNMMGVEDAKNGTDNQNLDALGELANVLCGNLLAKLAGPEPEFDLQPPQTLFRAAGQAPGMPAPAEQVHLNFDEGWAELTLVRP